MNLQIKKMDEITAKEISSWEYDPPYDFYNSPATYEALKEKLNGSYYALIDGSGELTGFFCMGESAKVPAGYRYGVYNDDFIDVGFGMKPELTGKGRGYNFCSFIIERVQEINTGTALRLSVATFNERAIHLYEKLGFTKQSRFSTTSTDFITMVR